MPEILSQPPSEYLIAESPTAGASFREFRTAVNTSGPLDAQTCELIVIAGLATGGYEDSFKHHSRRLLRMGVPKSALKQAVMVTLGASSVLFEVARALLWIDEIAPDES